MAERKRFGGRRKVSWSQLGVSAGGGAARSVHHGVVRDIWQ